MQPAMPKSPGRLFKYEIPFANISYARGATIATDDERISALSVHAVTPKVPLPAPIEFVAPLSTINALILRERALVQPLRASTNSDLKALNKQMDELAQRIGDVEKEVAAQGADKQQLIKTLKDTKTLIEDLVTSLDNWDGAVHGHLNARNTEAKSLFEKVKKNQTLLEKISGSNLETIKNLDFPENESDALLTPIFSKLSQMAKDIDSMIASLETSSSTSLPDNWQRDLQQAVDTTIKELEKKHEQALKEIEEKLNYLTALVEKQTEEIQKLAKLGLQTALLSSDLETAISLANQFSDDQIVIDTFSEVYRFEQLEILISFVQAFRKEKASLYHALRTRLSELERTPFWKKDKMVPQASSRDLGGEVTIYDEVYDLNFEENVDYREDKGKKRFIYADTIRIYNYRQYGHDLSLKARKIIFYRVDPINLSGKPGAPQQKAANGTSESCEGQKGKVGTGGGNGGKLKIVAGAMLFGSVPDDKHIVILLNGGRGGQGQQGGDGFSPPQPPDMPEPKLAGFGQGWNDTPKTTLREKVFRDAVWGYVGNSGTPGKSGGDSYAGAPGGEGGKPGSMQILAFEENLSRLLVSAVKGSKGSQAENGMVGKGAAGGGGGYYYYYISPAVALVNKGNDWQRGDSSELKKYISKSSGVFKDIKKDHPGFAVGSELKVRAEPGSRGNDGKLLPWKPD